MTGELKPSISAFIIRKWYIFMAWPTKLCDDNFCSRWIWFEIFTGTASVFHNLLINFHFPRPWALPMYRCLLR